MDLYDISVIEGTEAGGFESASTDVSSAESSSVTSAHRPLPRHPSPEVCSGPSVLSGSDESLDSLVRSCIAVAWSWPWTVLYSVKTKKLFYFNEMNQVLVPQLPHGTSLRKNDGVSSSTNRRRLSTELLYRSLNLKSDGNLADVSIFSLSEMYFGIDRSTSISNPVVDDDSRERKNRPIEFSQSSLSDRRLIGGASSDLSNCESISSLAEEILSKARSFPVSSPTSRPASSPSYNSSRPVSTIGSSRIKVSVGTLKKGNEDSYICFDSPHKPSGIRSLVLSILLLLRGEENRVLRERIFRKHMLGAAQRQRRLFEGVRVIDKSRKSKKFSQDGKVQFTGSVVEGSPTYKSLNEMFSSLSMQRLRESEFVFEKSMSIPEHNEYLNLLGEVSSRPSSVEAVLKLIIHLLKCRAFEAAVSFVERIRCFQSTYPLNDAERSFVDLLHKGFSSKFLGQFPRVKELKDLASRNPEDSMMLAFIAVYLDRVEFTDDAETYFLASLVRDPLNQIALRGYAHLLSVKKSDYLSAIKYLSRIGSDSSHSDAPVARLEMVGFITMQHQHMLTVFL